MACQALEEEEDMLRAYNDNIFASEEFVGLFWAILDTRDYMRARFKAADLFLRINTVEAVKKALEHFKDMLRLCRSDNLGARDRVPHLLLLLGQEQECYDFLKWWTTVDEEYNWNDTSLPYLDIHGASVFEPVNRVCSRGASLSHLSALALLKTRLYLDFAAFEDPEDYTMIGPPLKLDPYFDRHVGKIAQEAIRHMTSLDTAKRAELLQNQIREVCKAVHKTNSYFWDALIDEEPCVPPATYTIGSEEEAHYVVSFCQQAWNQSEDAVRTVECEVAELTPVYEGQDSGNEAAGVQMDSQTTTGERRRGCGAVFPKRFESPQPSSSPTMIFPCTPDAEPVSRFVSYDNHEMVLVFTDGSCQNNGQSNPRAGWAVVAGQRSAEEGAYLSIASGRLEDKGPFGHESKATSNRAELRAVIAALRITDWRREGFSSIVIATDSSYAVDGATSWAKGWIRNGWTTRTNQPVKNRDLWELLLGEVERWSERGLAVQLWKIPREQNGWADLAANKAADEPADEAVFRDFEEDASMVHDAVVDNSLNHILLLCIETGGWIDDVFGDLISSVTSRASSLQRATSQEEALEMLNKEPSPSTILILDAGPTQRLRVWKRVIDHLRAGATVVLAGGFSSSVTSGQFERFFARLGLPWKRSSYTRDTVRLQREAVGSPLEKSLPAAYSQKATFVRNVDKSAVWYAASNTLDEAAVVFAKVGRGRLGYIGDVNGEKGSNIAVLAMCGLLC